MKTRDEYYNELEQKGLYASFEDFDPKKRSLSLVFRYEEVGMQDLDVISEIFGTKLINIGSEERDDGYCETCSSPYSATIIRVSGITR